MAITTLAKDQVSPAVKGDLHRILALALQSLNRQLSFQRQLIRLQVRCPDHPGEAWQELKSILAGTAQADQKTILVGFAAQPGPAAFDQVSQLLVVVRTASSGEQCCQS